MDAFVPSDAAARADVTVTALVVVPCVTAIALSVAVFAI